MVTPTKSHPNSKSGAQEGSKRPQLQNQHHTKRQQNHPSISPSAVPSSNASMSQQQKGRSNHCKTNKSNFGNNSHHHQNRISPNPQTNNFNSSGSNNQRNHQQRQNRQTPPRNITTTNHVNMNNGQPSLERTASNPDHNQKNGTVQHKQHSQNSSHNHQTQKDSTANAHVSRSSPISANISKSNRSSPQGFAGSKCFEPPTPKSLPKPPSDWTLFLLDNKQSVLGNISQSLTFDDMAEANTESELDKHFSVISARDVSQELKLILNVHA